MEWEAGLHFQFPPTMGLREAWRGVVEGVEDVWRFMEGENAGREVKERTGEMRRRSDDAMLSFIVIVVVCI